MNAILKPSGVSGVGVGGGAEVAAGGDVEVAVDPSVVVAAAITSVGVGARTLVAPESHDATTALSATTSESLVSAVFECIRRFTFSWTSCVWHATALCNLTSAFSHRVGG